MKFKVMQLTTEIYAAHIKITTNKRTLGKKIETQTNWNKLVAWLFELSENFGFPQYS